MTPTRLFRWSEHVIAGVVIACLVWNAAEELPGWKELLRSKVQR